MVLLCTAHDALATIDSVESTDCISCDGSATVTTGIPGLVIYEWYNVIGTLIALEQNDQGASTVFNLCPGLYQVQYTNGTENSTEWFSIDLVGASAGQPGAMEVCSGTGNYPLFAELNGSPVAGGQWYDPQGTLHSGVFNSTTNTAGFYQYVIDDGNCLLVSGVDVSVIQNADPGLSATYLICETYNPFLLTDVLAGDPDYGGIWFNVQQNEIDGYYYPETDETSLFTYMIDTVPGCPPVFSTLFVIENQLPDPGLDTEIAVCPNAIAFDMTSVLNGSPEIDGTWYDDDNDVVSNIFDPTVMPEGTYNYVVSGATPCPAQESYLTITYTEGISAGEDGVVDLCSTSAPIELGSQLGGLPTSGGVWTDPQGVQIGGELDPSTAVPGVYSYTVDAIGCQPETSVVMVNIEEHPFAGNGAQIAFCENGSPVVPASLLDAITDGDGVWLVGGQPIIGDLVVEGGNTYDLVYLVEGDVCPDDQATYSVVVDDLPSAGPPAALDICSTDDAIDLSNFVDPDPGFALEWSAPDMNPVEPLIEPSTAISGDYTLTVVSGNSCPDASVVVSLAIADPVFPNSSVEGESCTSNEVIDLNAFLPEDYPTDGFWSTDGTNVPSELEMVSISSGTYLFTYPNDPACAASLFELNLSLVEPMSAGEGATLAVCSTEPVIDLEAQLSDASAGGQWLFEGESITDPFLEPVMDAAGVYQYVVPAVGPCPGDTSAVVLDVQEGFAFSAGPDLELCVGDEPVQIGGEPCDDCLYTWSDPSLLDNGSAANPLVFPPQSDQIQSYSISVTAANGVCAVEDEMLLTVYPLPNIAIDAPSSACAEDEIEIDLSGADSFTWSIMPDGITGADESISLIASEDIIVEVEGVSNYGCVASAEVQVEVFPLPQMEFELEPAAGCAPLSVELNFPVSDAELMWWQVDDQTIYEEEYLLILSEAGFHDVTLHLVSLDGCQVELAFPSFMEVYPTPEASFEMPMHVADILNTEIEFVNTSIGADEYLWNFGVAGTSSEESPSFMFPLIADQGYEICLTATTDLGCEDQICEDLFIEDEFLIYVPNAFTPDGDGLNEVFKPVTSGIDPDFYAFSIYDRWGELIYSTEDPKAGWIGNVHGGGYYAQNGVYTWVLEVRDRYTAEVFRETGHVTLLR